MRVLVGIWIGCSYSWDGLACQCDISREAVSVNFREALFSPALVPITNGTLTALRGFSRPPITSSCTSDQIYLRFIIVSFATHVLVCSGLCSF